MKLYGELAGWFYLLTAPPDYEEEATLYARLFVERASGPVERVLELGSGGGNNASHMKDRFRLTLTDLSPAMLELSRGLNPECEHLQGDMRTLRLGRTFDAVFVHDAVMYMATPEDLQAAMATAVEHCRPGGVVLFTPDCVRETFFEYVHEGGHDGDDGRSLRYRETASRCEPDDGTYRVELEMRLCEAGGAERVETDVYSFGLFRKSQWLAWMSDAGLAEVEALPSSLGGEGVPTTFTFVGVRPT